MLNNQKRIANMAYTTAENYGIDVVGGNNSHTDTKRVTIHSDEVLKGIGLSEDEALIMQLSASAHEGGHVKRSKPEAMKEYMMFMAKKRANLELANGLLQVIEDYWNDSEIAKEYPGYEYMTKDSVQLMGKIFGNEVHGNPSTQFVKALSGLPYGYDLSKFPAWKNAVEWDIVKEMAKELMERVDAGVTSTFDNAEIAKELYEKHIGFPDFTEDDDDEEMPDIPMPGGTGEMEKPEGTDYEEQESDSSEQQATNDEGNGDKEETPDGDGDENKDESGNKKGDPVPGDTSSEGGTETKEQEMTEEELEALIEELVEDSIGKTMLETMAGDSQKLQRATEKARLKKEQEQSNEHDKETVRRYMTNLYGAPILTPQGIKLLEDKVGTGCNAGAGIHYVDISEKLKDPSSKESYYVRNQKLGIKSLDAKASQLGSAIRNYMMLKLSETSHDTTTGKIVPNRVWKATECGNSHVFRQTEEIDEGGFIVDLVVDASGSNHHRENRVGQTAYIVAKAFTSIGIPTRVTSFRADNGFTILQRYRDYDDADSKTQDVLAYRADGSNRDGLAYRSVYELADKTHGMNHIMICISDGLPADTSGIIGSSGGIAQYQNLHDENGNRNRDASLSTASKRYFHKGMDGLDDSALAIREIRSKGTAVLGVFVQENDYGIKQKLTAEKIMFGNDFSWVQDINDAVGVIGQYLKKQIQKTFS